MGTKTSSDEILSLVEEIERRRKQWEEATRILVPRVVSFLKEAAVADGKVTEEEEDAIAAFSKSPSVAAFNGALEVIKRSRPRKLIKRFAPIAGVVGAVVVILAALIFFVSSALRPSMPTLAPTPALTPRFATPTSPRTPTSAPLPPTVLPRQAPSVSPLCRVAETVPPGAEKFQIADNNVVTIVGKWTGQGERAAGRQVIIGDKIYSEVYAPEGSVPLGWCQVK